MQKTAPLMLKQDHFQRWDLSSCGEKRPEVVLVGIAQRVGVQVVGDALVEGAQPQKVGHHADH